MTIVFSSNGQDEMVNDVHTHYAIAGDTGGSINGNKIDVHVPTKAEAQRWGRKQVKITVLD